MESENIKSPMKVSRRNFLKLAGATAAVGAGATVGNAVVTQTSEAIPMDGEELIRTVCAPNCTGSCAIDARVRDGKLVGVQPGKFPDESFNRMCLKGISNAMQRVYSDNRIKYPMRRVGERGEGKWEQLSWDEAMDYIVSEHKRIADEYGPEANAWISMTGSYGVFAQVVGGRAANTVKGTNFTAFGIMGDNASNMGFIPTTGVQQEGHAWSDLKGSKLSIFFGCNYMETTVNDSHFVLDAKKNGCKLVVVDPRFSRTAAKADWWIPIRPGTDAALMLGMTQHIIANDMHDEPFLKRFTVAPFLVREDTKDFVREADLGGAGEGYVAWDTQANAPLIIQPNPADPYPNHIMYDVTDPEVVQPPHGDEVALTGSQTLNLYGQAVKCTPVWELYVEQLNKNYTPKQASDLCEVPEADIIKLAEMYATTEPASLRMSQGTQRYWQGHQGFRTGNVLAAICGNVGKKHAGFSWSDGSLMRFLFSVPGEWVVPDLAQVGKSRPGTQFVRQIIEEDPYPVKSLWVVAYGLGTQAPEREKMFTEAFDKLDLVVVNEMVMTPACDMADIVLPIPTWYEETGDVIGAWSNKYLQVRHKVIDTLWEAKTDWQIFKMYGEKMGVGHLWDMTDEESGRFVVENSPNPQFSKMDVDKLYKDGVAEMIMPDDFYPFADQRYPTPSGRFHMYSPELLKFGEEFPIFSEPIESNRTDLASKYPLTFMNCRSVYTAHSTHTQLPWIRELNPEPLLEINTKDAADRGINDGDMVEVFNDRGSFKLKAFVTEGIKPGCTNMRQGWWPADFGGDHYANILHMQLNPVQDFISETNYAPYDNLIEVKKA